jgi:hypothetical protein
MQRPAALSYKSSIGVWIWALAAACLMLADSAPAAGDGRNGTMTNCDIQKGPCEKVVAATKVTLDILPKPVKAMHDLTFRVTVADPGKMSEMPYINLNMPAMNMGTNKVLLKDLGQGVFEGRGVIVRCMSGRRTWRARITFPNLGRADFIFDVVY